MGTLEAYALIDEALEVYLAEYDGYGREDFVDFVVTHLFGKGQKVAGRVVKSIEQVYEHRLAVRRKGREGVKP